MYHRSCNQIEICFWMEEERKKKGRKKEEKRKKKGRRKEERENKRNVQVATCDNLDMQVARFEIVSTETREQDQ